MCDRCRCVVVQAGIARRPPGVRDALLFVLIRALYCASLQIVQCRTRGREDELKCGPFCLLENQSLLMLTLVSLGITPAIRNRYLEDDTCTTIDRDVSCDVTPAHVQTPSKNNFNENSHLVGVYLFCLLAFSLWGDQCLDAVACECSINRLIRPIWLLCVKRL